MISNDGFFFCVVVVENFPFFFRVIFENVDVAERDGPGSGL